MPDSTLIQLFEREGQVWSCTLQDTLINGEFTFRDTTSVPRIVGIIPGRGKGFPSTFLEIWVASGKYIKVSGQDKLIKTWLIESDIPEQQEENRYNVLAIQETKELMKYSLAINDLQQLRSKENNNDSRKKIQTRIDSIRELEDILQKQVQKKNCII